MQTLEFTRALREIILELKINELATTMMNWLLASPISIAEHDKDRFQSLVLQSNAGYDSLMREPDTKRILELMGTQELYDPGRLRRMTVTVSNTQNSHQLRLPDFYNFFETLRSFQKMESTCRELLEAGKIGVVPESDRVLELEVTDYGETGVSPERLMKIINLVTKLHANLARIHGIADDKLKIKYLDSGSGFLLGIEAAKAIIGSLNTLLIEWWDKLRFARYDTFNKKLEAVGNSLTIMGTIKKSEDDHVIDAEVAKNLRRRVLVEVDHLVGLGATIPLEEQAIVDQQALLIQVRETKLLTGGVPDEPDEDVPSSGTNNPEQ